MMMKKCAEYLNDLNDYLDGELDESLCAEIEAHVGECRNCKLMIDTLRQTVKLCRESGECESLPEDISRRLNNALKARWEQKFGKQTR
jgi:predicted anti-sigma-YlaC factor YlaD